MYPMVFFFFHERIVQAYCFIFVSPLLLLSLLHGQKMKEIKESKQKDNAQIPKKSNNTYPCRAQSAFRNQESFRVSPNTAITHPSHTCQTCSATNIKLQAAPRPSTHPFQVQYGDLMLTVHVAEGPRELGYRPSIFSL